VEAKVTSGLTRRSLVASALLALIVGGTFAVVLLAISDLRQFQQQTIHAQNVLTASNELERLLLDLETGQRGFILTGEERFLQPWLVARERFLRGPGLFCSWWRTAHTKCAGRGGSRRTSCRTSAITRCRW
jgi:hypothetical protein